MMNEGSGPAKPPRLQVVWETVGDQICLKYRPRAWVVVIFLMIWLTGWTFGCVMLAGKLITEFEWFMLLFSIPFFAGEVFVTFFLLTLLFYREEFTLDANGARLRTWILWPWSDRTISASEILKFAVDEKKGDETTTWRLRLESTGEPVFLFTDLPRGELDYLAFELNQQLVTQGIVQRKSEAEEGSKSEAADLDGLPEVLELRPPAETSVDRPSTSRWERTNEVDDIHFHTRGQFSLVGIGLTLFVLLFWNGIVSVFVCQLIGVGIKGEGAALKGAEWWFLFFFLIPFELVGAAILVGFLLVLIDPLRKSAWTCRRNRVECAHRWLGIGSVWRYEITELDRLELRRIDMEKLAAKKGIEFNAATHDVGPRYQLALVNTQGGDVCAIPGLTLAEACWMAAVILAERKVWFG